MRRLNIEYLLQAGSCTRRTARPLYERLGSRTYASAVGTWKLGRASDDERFVRERVD
jgi:hypothetical protein